MFLLLFLLLLSFVSGFQPVNGPSPEDEVASVEASEWLAGEIAELPEREQIVLSLYYNDEMNLKEIGAILGVSESRVSQILTKVVGKLRDRVAF